jgi:predicted RNase H-like HicB family nuclease
MKKTYWVVYEKGKNNYGGFSPDVPGCISLGDTLDEIRVNLAEALQLYIDTAVELGYPIPEPTSKGITIPLDSESGQKASYVVEQLTINIPRVKATKRKLRQTRQPSTPKRRALQTA